MAGVKLDNGDLFLLVKGLRDFPLPDSPEKFPGRQEATQAMEEGELRERLEEMGVSPPLVLGMAGRDMDHDSLVALAHLAILAAREKEQGPDTSKGDKEETAPKAKKARVEVFRQINQSFYTVGQ